MVQVTISWGGQFQSSEANIVKSFVINDHTLIGIFDQLMYGQGSVVWFNDSVRYFWGWDNWECFHDSVWVFFSDFGNQKSSHTRSGSTTQRVGDLESLKAVASFGFFSDDIQNWVDQFSSFGVMSFGPVISGSGLSENEVVWSEELSEWSSSDWVHGSWFQVHKDGSWDITATSGFVVIDVNSFQLEVRISVICSGWVNSVFIRNDFPEFSTDLVTTLSSLNVNDFSHFY